MERETCWGIAPFLRHRNQIREVWRPRFLAVPHPFSHCAEAAAAAAAGDALTCWQHYLQCLCFSAAMTQSFFPAAGEGLGSMGEFLVPGGSPQPMRYWSGTDSDPRLPLKKNSAMCPAQFLGGFPAAVSPCCTRLQATQHISLALLPSLFHSPRFLISPSPQISCIQPWSCALFVEPKLKHVGPLKSPRPDSTQRKDSSTYIFAG